MSSPAPRKDLPGLQEPVNHSSASDTRPASRNSGVQAEVRRIHQILKDAGHLEEFRKLQRPRPGAAAAQMLLSWSLIALAWILVMRVSTAFLPLSLVLVASRQRALGNTLHDASHGNAFRRGSEWLAQWFLAAPLCEELSLYRRNHLAHHARLGDPREDPDFMDIPARLQGTPGARSPARIYLYTALDRKLWFHHTAGELAHLPWHGLVRVAVWWAALPVVLGWALGMWPALSFAALWFGSRATCFHLLKTFTELSDHVGLPVGSILSYTRNMPANWASVLLHPHNDAYHLTHHLAPRVCMANLPRMHQLLMGVREYRDGHQCDGYLFGNYPVARSWAQPKSLQSSRP